MLPDHVAPGRGPVDEGLVAEFEVEMSEVTKRKEWL